MNFHDKLRSNRFWIGLRTKELMMHEQQSTIRTRQQACDDRIVIGEFHTASLNTNSYSTHSTVLRDYHSFGSTNWKNCSDRSPSVQWPYIESCVVRFYFNTVKWHPTTEYSYSSYMQRSLPLLASPLPSPHLYAISVFVVVDKNTI